jgi:hypothetical protein
VLQAAETCAPLFPFGNKHDKITFPKKGGMMKKIRTLVIILLLVALPILILRTSERSRLMRNLDAKSRQLNSLLDKEKYEDWSELGNALNSYLSETSFVLNHHGMLFGNYFSRQDKQIIFDNACKYLLRVKKVLLTNPSFYYNQLPDLDNVVNLFYENVGTASHINKDQVNQDILKHWNESGERDGLYMTKDELNQHRLLAMEGRRREDQERMERLAAKNKEQMPQALDIPGLEGVERMKQREVTRVSRLVIPLDKVDDYLGQKLNFTLQNGRQLSGKCAGTGPGSIAIDFSTEGGPLVMKIARENIAKIEKVAIEKVLEMYDPTMEHESRLKPGFQELEYIPYPKSKEYIGFVTIGNKMVFISTTTGALTCHSKENKEGYKPMATRIPANWHGDLQIFSQFQVVTGDNVSMGSKTVYFSDLAWYKSFDNANPDRNFNVISSKKLNGELNLTFEISLSRLMPGASAPIIINQRDLVLNSKNIRLMFHAQSLDGALNAIGNPKYGKGELPWEYDLNAR